MSCRNFLVSIVTLLFMLTPAAGQTGLYSYNFSGTARIGKNIVRILFDFAGNFSNFEVCVGRNEGR